jgi:hypothetical protein
MKNARDWYLADWFVCTPGLQVLERVVESLLITCQPTADRSRTSFQIYSGTYICWKYLFTEKIVHNTEYLVYFQLKVCCSLIAVRIGINFFSENLRGREENPDVDGRIILKLNFGVGWCGWDLWGSRIEAGGGLFGTWHFTFVFHKMIISWPDERLLAF